MSLSAWEITLSLSLWFCFDVLRDSRFLRAASSPMKFTAEGSYQGYGLMGGNMGFWAKMSKVKMWCKIGYIEANKELWIQRFSKMNKEATACNISLCGILCRLFLFPIWCKVIITSNLIFECGCRVEDGRYSCCVAGRLLPIGFVRYPS